VADLVGVGLELGLRRRRIAEAPRQEVLRHALEFFEVGLGLDVAANLPVQTQEVFPAKGQVDRARRGLGEIRLKASRTMFLKLL
jgi:hypothetical protein